MRKIDTSRFRVATRRTSREINRTHRPQPGARAAAPLARGPRTRHGRAPRRRQPHRQRSAQGRRHRRRRDRRCRPRPQAHLPLHRHAPARVVAIDIRISQTLLMLADMVGKPIGGIVTLPTERDPKRLVKSLAAASSSCSPTTRTSMNASASASRCPAWWSARRCACCTRRRSDGVTSICARCSPRATGLPVEIENSGRACALAQLWAMHGGGRPAGDFVFVSVSDGLGVGVSFQREVLRGRHNLAGEFGHLPLSMDGPRCSCGSTGCWEAYVSNRATLARYFGQ